jgi:hypothetical protein
MNRKFVAVAFNPQKIGRGLLSLRAADRGVLSLRAADKVSTDFCSFITEICILLFFFASNSKITHLLITIYASDTNRIQREFLFNNAIHSQNFCHAQKLQPKRPIFSNQFKLSFVANQKRRRRAVTSRHR